MKRNLIAIGIMLMTSATVNAQFNGLAKKVKEVAKSSTPGKVVQNAASSQTGELSTVPSAPKSSYDPFKTYTPSAAAKQADQMASATEVKKHYTKSPAAIRGAYEHLDAALFPYKPYYKFNGKGLYLDGTTETEDFVYYMMTECRTMMEDSYRKVNGCTNNGTVPIGDGEKVVPWSEIPINAFFAEFFADPNSYMAYRQMIKAYVLAQEQFLGRFRVSVDEGSDQTVTNSSGKQTLFEPESKRVKRNSDLMGVAFDIAMQSNYDNVFNSTYSMLTQGDKQYNNGNMAGALTNYREFVTSFDHFLQKHPGWSSDDRAGQFTEMYKEARKKLQKAQDALFDEKAEPEPMPTTYNVNAEIKQMAREVIAKEDPEHKNAPIYFLTNGWRTLTRNGFITHRAVDVGWEYKDEKGQRWLNHGVMMQQAEYRGMTVIYLEGKYGMSGGFTRTKIK